MYAIRALKMAAGADVEGTHYSHTAWTLTDKPTEAELTLSQPGMSEMVAVLEILEVESAEDAALPPYPVTNPPVLEAAESAATDTDSSKGKGKGKGKKAAEASETQGAESAATEPETETSATAEPLVSGAE